MIERKPSYMNREQFIESVIDKQLLIQEAVKLKINKEENFRLSVESFYEQSLIKILLDRELESLNVEVPSEEIAKYKTFSQNKFFLTKNIYPSMKDAANKTNATTEKIEAAFLDLSGYLKFMVLNLNIGDSSKPMISDFRVFVYRLDDIKKIEGSNNIIESDSKQVSLFLQDKKKEHLLDEWSEEIRKKAKIWRKNE